jgi:hypothetical protein
VVIRYFYVVGIAIPPHEAQAELLVDRNTVLAFTVMAQLFQSVSWRSSQILESGGCVEHGQFLSRSLSRIRGRHSPAFSCVPEILRTLVREGLDHETKFNVSR